MGNQLTPTYTREQAREVYARFADNMNRAMRRKLLKEIRSAKLEGEGEERKVVHQTPIHVSKPVSRSEAIERTVQLLMDGMAKHTEPGTPITLRDVLDHAEGQIVERAWRAGQPIPREQVRAAVQEIYRRGEAMRGGK